MGTNIEMLNDCLNDALEILAGSRRKTELEPTKGQGGPLEISILEKENA